MQSLLTQQPCRIADQPTSHHQLGWREILGRHHSTNHTELEHTGAHMYSRLTVPSLRMLKWASAEWKEQCRTCFGSWYPSKKRNGHSCLLDKQLGWLFVRSEQPWTGTKARCYDFTCSTTKSSFVHEDTQHVLHMHTAEESKVSWLLKKAMNVLIFSKFCFGFVFCLFCGFCLVGFFEFLGLQEGSPLAVRLQGFYVSVLSNLASSILPTKRCPQSSLRNVWKRHSQLQ